MRAVGVIAAAGRSSRMGMNKALLPFSRGKVFVSRIADVMLAAGLAPVVVTTPDDEETAAVIAAHLIEVPAQPMKNEWPERGLTGSVLTALASAPDADSVVLTPVDCPFIDVTLVHALLVALRRGVAAAPVVSGVRGHPVAFARPAFELLWSAADRGGPRAVLDALGDDVVDVPWIDPRVCEDVDTPEDYERLFRRAPPRQR